MILYYYFITYARIIGFYFSRIWEVVVHWKSLHFRQFSNELLILSYEHRLYLIRQHCLLRSTHFPPLDGTSLRRNSRWAFSYSEFSCRLSIFQHLGFNLMLYSRFFPLSQHSRLSLFHLYVVVLLSLGVSGNSSSIE